VITAQGPDRLQEQLGYPVACVQMPPYPHEKDFYQELLMSLGTVVPEGLSLPALIMDLTGGRWEHYRTHENVLYHT
jgi:hypothetical protein